MREILFRGKNIDNGEWVEGMPWIFKDRSMICPWHKGMCKYDTGFYPVAVIPKTVGQFTGLTDKNGVKIFENGYMIIDNKTYKVTFNNAEYILINIFNRDIITLKNNSIKGVFVDEI